MLYFAENDILLDASRNKVVECKHNFRAETFQLQLTGSIPKFPAIWTDEKGYDVCGPFLGLFLWASFGDPFSGVLLKLFLRTPFRYSF